jgi:hypothetical protein
MAWTWMATGMRFAEQRLHQLVRQPGAIDERIFEIAFPDVGIEVYAFTYG